jgi:CBS domain-containing protein
MQNVRDVLAKKGSQVWSIEAGRTVYEALELMATKDVGALLVLDGGRPVGMFSERDYARQVILMGKASKETAVRDVMTTKVVYVQPQQNVEECMAIMTERRIRHLPVLEGGAVIGLVSIGDVVKAVISEKQFLIEQLEHYITSG